MRMDEILQHREILTQLDFFLSMGSKKWKGKKELQLEMQ